MVSRTGPHRFVQVPSAPSYGAARPALRKLPPAGLVFTNLPFLDAADPFFAYALPSHAYHARSLSTVLDANANAERLATGGERASACIAPRGVDTQPAFSVRRMHGSSTMRLQLPRAPSPPPSSGRFAAGESSGALAAIWGADATRVPAPARADPTSTLRAGRVVRKDARLYFLPAPHIQAAEVRARHWADTGPLPLAQTPGERLVAVPVAVRHDARDEAIASEHSLTNESFATQASLRLPAAALGSGASR
ncbi:hypothetical protein KFE25_008396 [Diacronema lutheri]|uniref:Uncharacterized protein n=1 Tax=Diacronema lutheri TaxID=2081491 RepID=A0A8J5XD10_DIALT|nr:hypothetical protein KFE25_008396 [Diacronema lutheri]